MLKCSYDSKHILGEGGGKEREGGRQRGRGERGRGERGEKK